MFLFQLKFDNYFGSELKVWQVGTGFAFGNFSSLTWESLGITIGIQNGNKMRKIVLVFIFIFLILPCNDSVYWAWLTGHSH